jgi:hypothetical protein
VRIRQTPSPDVTERKNILPCVEDQEKRHHNLAKAFPIGLGRRTLLLLLCFLADSAVGWSACSARCTAYRCWL